MVDDDGLLVKVLTVLLEEQGHVVTSALDAMSAVLELGKPAAPDRTADGNRSVGSFGAKDELSRAARALEATAKTWLNTDFTTVDDAQRRQFSAAVAALAVAAGLPGTNLSAH